MNMKSTARLRAKKAERSIPLEIAREDPSLVVAPSAPTTRDAKTDMPKGYRAAGGLWMLAGLSVPTFIVSHMIITCETCAVRDIGCGDCVLTFFLEKKQDQSAHCEIPDKTAEAIDLLSSRGIIRPLRFNSA
jgi:hypothetical protein